MADDTRITQRSATSSSLDFLPRLKELVERLEARQTVATRALVPEGRALIATFEMWEISAPPKSQERWRCLVQAHSFMDAAQIVLGKIATRS